MRSQRALLQRFFDTHPERAQRAAARLRKAGWKEETPASALRLVIGEPEPIKNGIPTLRPGVYRKASPMLRERFRIAGKVTYSIDDWLGISDMERALKNKQLMQRLAGLARHWEGSAPAVFPRERLSLFWVAPRDATSIAFLVWPESAKGEPELWTYFGQNASEYKNLDEFLKWAMS